MVRGVRTVRGVRITVTIPICSKLLVSYPLTFLAVIKFFGGSLPQSPAQKNQKAYLFI